MIPDQALSQSWPASHLKELYQRSVEQFTESESDVLKNLLLEYEDVFARHDMDLGSYTTTTHRIHTGDAAPIRMRMRRTPLTGRRDSVTVHVRPGTRTTVRV